MSAPGESEGRGPDFKSAAEDAWRKAKEKGDPAGEYEVKKIYVVADNPIREYRVVIKKT